MVAPGIPMTLTSLEDIAVMNALPGNYFMPLDAPWDGFARMTSNPGPNTCG